MDDHKYDPKHMTWRHDGLLNLDAFEIYKIGEKGEVQVLVKLYMEMLKI